MVLGLTCTQAATHLQSYGVRVYGISAHTYIGKRWRGIADRQTPSLVRDTLEDCTDYAKVDQNGLGLRSPAPAKRRACEAHIFVPTHCN